MTLTGPLPWKPEWTQGRSWKHSERLRIWKIPIVAARPPSARAESKNQARVQSGPDRRMTMGRSARALDLHRSSAPESQGRQRVGVLSEIPRLLQLFGADPPQVFRTAG